MNLILTDRTNCDENEMHIQNIRQKIRADTIKYDIKSHIICIRYIKLLTEFLYAQW